MSLRGLQTVIARMCLDRQFRSEAVSAPTDRLAEFGLSDAEHSAIQQIDHTALSAFGDHLIEKRVRMIMQWFPLSFTLLGRAGYQEAAHLQLVAFTQEVVRADTEVGGRWRRIESQRASDHLSALVATGVLPVPHLVDLLAFELECLRLTTQGDPAECATQDGDSNTPEADRALVVPEHVSIQHFGYNVPQLVEWVHAGHELGELQHNDCCVLFVRRPRQPLVDTYVIGAGSQALLAACRRPNRALEAVTAAAMACGGMTNEVSDSMFHEELLRLAGLGALVTVSRRENAPSRRTPQGKEVNEHGNPHG